MCLNPRLIKNPNSGIDSASWMLKDTKSQFIPVPCGHCAECVELRALSIRQRCELEEMMGHPFMILLTWKNSLIPKFPLSNGYRIPYADFTDLVNMFKRLRKSNVLGRPFRYIAVSERGGEHGRPHIHMILYLKKDPSDNQFDIMNLEQLVHDSVLAEWKRNCAELVLYNYKSGVKLLPNVRSPYWKPLCVPIEYVRCGKIYGTYGCHYVSPFATDGTTLGATHYISKYFLKRDEYTIRLQRYLRLNLDDDEYKKVWNTVKTGYISSLNFGFGLYDKYNAKKVSRSERMEILSKLDTFKHLKQSLDWSLLTQDKPRYYEIESGKPIPLSRYFYHIDNLYDYHIYSHFKELNNQSGDYFQFSDRDSSQLHYQSSIKERNLINKLQITDSLDLL